LVNTWSTNKICDLYFYFFQNLKLNKNQEMRNEAGSQRQALALAKKELKDLTPFSKILFQGQTDKGALAFLTNRLYTI
jgi:hypothetical protein